MAKKKQHRTAAAQSADADAADSARPLLMASSTATTARDALQPALERLDAIAQEAHVYTQQLKQQQQQSGEDSAQTSSLKRPRDEAGDGRDAAGSGTAPAASRLDVFAVTTALEYRNLCATVAACGLQLLPSLADVAKRVSLAVLTPALSTPEAWETMAMLCTTYRAGMSHAVGELLDSLLREPGVLLLDAPQLVPAWYAEAFVHVLPNACAANTLTASYGGLLAFAEDQRMRASSAVDGNEASVSSVARMARAQTDRVARKLQALVSMIYAVGEYVAAATLQQVALRHTMEVVEGGLLPCYVSASEAGVENVATFKASATAGATAPSTSSSALHWRVPPAWHAACLQLLEAFLFTIRPALPAQLLVSASRVVTLVTGRLHRGLPVYRGTSATAGAAEADDGAAKDAPPLPVSHDVSSAVVRLSYVLHILRHPAVFAPFQPAQLTLEKAKRRVWSAEAAPAEESSGSTAETRVADVTPVPTAPAAVVVPAEVAKPAPVVEATAASVSLPTPSVTPTAPAAAAKVAAPAAVPPARPAAVTTTAASAPVRPMAAVVEEDDDIPDIDMDD